MSIRHIKTEEWEARLKEIFDRLDDYLEDKYAEKLSLHPRRPRRGETANKEHSGLFNVGASFSMGYGSNYGPGYVIEILIATGEPVEEELKKQIAEEVRLFLAKELKKEFPCQQLEVAWDGGVLKIFGDLSLGRV